MTAGDSALARASQLVAQGKTAEARAVVQSVLASTPSQSLTYASALYARASLATNADSAERDYRRITVEYSASPKASDALLRLAQLELARGNRDQAATHLARLTRELPPGQTGVAYARTQLQIGLAYLDLQDMTKACTALAAASAAAPTTDVELKNRIDYNAQRCPTAASPAPSKSVGAAKSASASQKPAVATAPALSQSASKAAAPASAGVTTAATAVPPAPSPGPPAAKSQAPANPIASQAPPSVPAAAPVTVPAAPPSVARAPAAAPTKPAVATPTPSTPAPAAAAATTTRARGPGYTVQVAAYQTQQAAETLADELKAKGYPVRVFGVAAPFRVRIGRYPTEAQADSVARALKAKGQVGFVTAAEPLAP
jgi:tetratricopeptide (TPR) repeat protein